MLRSFLAVMVVLSAGVAAALTPPDAVKPVAQPEPDLPDGTAAAVKQMAAFRLPPGMRVDLFAAEPMLASPVAIGLDDRNRVFVAEEYRFNQGTEENRTRGFFLDDDLQLKTVADRLKMYEKHAAKFPGGAAHFTKHADQVRLLTDATGSGKATKSSVFAGGFNAPADGLAAGVMAGNGKVYFTCIPNLWELSEEKAGVATKREALLTGFGVNCAFLGHDLHGLTWGPDGKIYFSVGDRGFHVATKEGTTLSGPRTGAVFKCNPDGTELEVVHRGLRNPQELAFDEHGNLFADDNNCDKGDHARLVYVFDGGESGWNMAYQTIPDPYLTGPWHAERMWHLPQDGGGVQPAWIVPCAGKIGTGPSGFLFTSGTSLGDRYKNAFIMCNFTGGGGLEAFKVRPQGAGFEVVDYHDFLKPIRATDAEFGTDGKLYIADFVDLKWDGGSAGGRVYTAYDPAKIASPAVLETKKLFADGFDKQATQALGKLLAHADQRVRQRAHYELAKRGPDGLAQFVAVANRSGDGLDRLHAVWGLGMVLAKHPAAAVTLTALLADANAEVRAQAAKTLGERKVESSAAPLMALLDDAAPRVVFMAAQALGQLKHAPAADKLFEVIRTNDNRDPTLRHAVVTALTRVGGGTRLAGTPKDTSAAVRLAAVLVLRQQKSARLAAFLTDADAGVRTEAARAIHDAPVEALMPALAARAATLTGPDGDAYARRALDAAFRAGTADHATAVLSAVTNPDLGALVRGEALAMLRDWATPGPRDRVTGVWRPVESRPAVAQAVVQAGVDRLLAGTSGKLQSDAVETLVTLKVEVNEAKAVGWATDAKADVNLRAAALKLLADRKARPFDALAAAALKSGPPALAAAVRDIVAETRPDAATKMLLAVLSDNAASLVERQRGLGTLARLKTDDAGVSLDVWAGRLVLGEVPVEMQVDVLDALKAAPSPYRDGLRAKFEGRLPKDPVGKFRSSLTGGDAARGREVFVNHAAAQCVRCHAVNGQGGVAGPDLTKVGERNPVATRDYLLESIVLPSAKIAVGFATVTLTLADGRVVAGTVLAEDEKCVTVQTPDGKKQVVPLDEIDARTAPVSAMPSAERALTPREMRDLIEYLATLK
jgi:quinoprotein glucose dehydrogenase